MKKILTFCLAVLLAVSAQAQMLNFPQFGNMLKITGSPVIGLERLSVGDEGYVTFQIRNESDTEYKGPLYLRIFERESSFQVLACRKISVKPGREYSVTTVFPTDRLAAYARYFIGFEYDEDGHTVPMSYVTPGPLKTFMLLPPIINNPKKKSPVKAKVKEVKNRK